MDDIHSLANVDVPRPAEATVAHHRRKAMYDVVIVGCGVSCLAALEEIKRHNESVGSDGAAGQRMIKFVVLESNPERVGGRAHTYEIVVDDDAFHVDLGGTWLHGTEAHPFLVENLVSIDETMPISKTNFWTSRILFNLSRDKLDQEIELYLPNGDSIDLIRDDEHGENLNIGVKKMFKDIYQICISEVKKYEESVKKTASKIGM